MVSILFHDLTAIFLILFFPKWRVDWNFRNLMFPSWFASPGSLPSFRMLNHHKYPQTMDFPVCSHISPRSPWSPGFNLHITGAPALLTGSGCSSNSHAVVNPRDWAGGVGFSESDSDSSNTHICNNIIYIYTHRIIYILHICICYIYYIYVHYIYILHIDSLYIYSLILHIIS